MRKLFLGCSAALAALTLAPAASAAMTSDGTTTDATALPVQEDDDDDFPWGLLGLIGLAGLLGRKRDDHRVHDTTTRRP